MSKMFKCRACGAHEFQLMLNPSYQGSVEITANEHDEVVIQANNREFIADLMFMNRFAMCHCGAIQQWEYYFPNLHPAE